MHVDQNVGTVKGNERWFRPCLEQGQQEHRDMAKINVEQLCVYVSENASQCVGLSGRNFPGAVGNLFKPDSSQKMQRWLLYDANFLEWKTIGILAFLRDDHWSHSLKRNDLAVDVEHLRFEKSRAIGCNDGTTLVFDQKVMAKSLIPFHFPGTSG